MYTSGLSNSRGLCYNVQGSTQEFLPVTDVDSRKTDDKANDVLNTHIVEFTLPAQSLFGIISKADPDFKPHLNIGLVTKKFFDSINQNNQSFKQIDTVIYSNLSLRDLLTLRNISHQVNDSVMTGLIQDLNNNEIILTDLNFEKITDVINFFGERCLEIHGLDLQRFDFTDSDIEKMCTFFPNITSLSFKRTHIKDLNFLERFSKLTALNLKLAELITDFSPLGKLSNLISLDLSETHISDIGFLEKLQKLKSLSLAGVVLPHYWGYEIVTLLSHITSLNLSGCCEISDFSFLLKLQNLISLNVSDCRNFSGFDFQKFQKLTSLNLSFTDFSDISLIENLQNLTSLDLSDTDISGDVSGLRKLQKLEHLNLSSCDIADISFLKDLKNLKTVKMQDTPFAL